MPSLRTAIVLLGLVGAAAPARAATDDPAGVRRLLTMLAGIRDEYREALDDAGKLVAPREIEEARLLIAEAREQAKKLGAAVPPTFATTMDAVQAGIDRTAPTDDVVGPLDELRAAVSEASGVSADSGPPAPPSIERGAALFADNCSGCHGARGAGDGEEAAHLAIRPANFSDPTFMRAETPQDFFNVISLGRRRSGMPAWEEVLSVQQRWDLVAFTWTLAAPGPPDAGTPVYAAACGGCHGETAAGGGDVPNLSTTLSLAQRTDADLLSALGSPSHAGVTLGEADRLLAVGWLRERSLAGGSAPGEAAVEGELSLAGLEEARRLLAAAVAAAADGDAAAGQLATDAYIAFEPFERRLRVSHGDLAIRIEEQFLELRTLVRGEGGQDRIAALGRTIDADLATATMRLAAPSSAGRWATFVQAIAIILREGFEVILVVGALAAYVRRSGHAHMLGAIRGGVVLGLVASLLTAIGLVQLARNAAVAGEVLEGAALLLASVVLFWVSYWLIAKSEADRWQRYIVGKVQGALGRGSTVGLALAAFLAVYREGFETMLFYQALLGASGGALDVVLGGFAVGCGALALLWIAMNRIGMRVPITQFFLVTGVMLYALAVIFAGQGVAELQEGSVVGVTPVPSMPTIPWLGVFPTVETLAAQATLLALALGAIVVLALRRARARAVANPSASPGEVEG
jgi:high-affinity iron transporter